MKVVHIILLGQINFPLQLPHPAAKGCELIIFFKEPGFTVRQNLIYSACLFNSDHFLKPCSKNLLNIDPVFGPFSLV